MKSLLEIQKDIRNLEKNIGEFDSRLKQINSELNILREGSSEILNIDYEQIERISRYIVFTDHPLEKLEDGYSCKLYLMVLANLIRIDSDGKEEKLIFLQWMLTKSRINVNLEQLLKDSYSIDSEQYDELIEALVADYRLYFILDALIIANIVGKANDEAYVYIANLCTILGIEKIDVQILSKLANIILEQKAAPIEPSGSVDLRKYTNKFKHYLPKEFIRKDRTLAVKVNRRWTDFKWKAKQGSYVEKDQLLAVYGIDKIWASRPGIIFQFKNEKYYYGAISNIFDNKDSIKEWIKQYGGNL